MTSEEFTPADLPTIRKLLRDQRAKIAGVEGSALTRDPRVLQRLVEMKYRVLWLGLIEAAITSRRAAGVFYDHLASPAAAPEEDRDTRL